MKPESSDGMSFVYNRGGMLSRAQVDRVWELMFEAEVRSFYFGDLASRYTRRKQWISGLAFFLSSGAAATVIANAQKWIPVVLSVVTAAMTAYSIAVGLDKKALAMSKLHASWNRIATELERLWHHWYEADAEHVLENLMDRIIDVSESGTEAPYEPQLLEKWGKIAAEKYRAAA